MQGVPASGIGNTCRCVHRGPYFPRMRILSRGQHALVSRTCRHPSALPLAPQRGCPPTATPLATPQAGLLPRKGVIARTLDVGGAGPCAALLEAQRMVEVEGGCSA